MLAIIYSLIDIVITLLLEFNLQFNDFTQTGVIETMLKFTSLKVFKKK